jgi:hypothetical protein
MLIVGGKEPILSFQEELSCEAITKGFPPWWPMFNPRSSNVGFVVDKVALGQVSLPIIPPNVQSHHLGLVK